MKIEYIEFTSAGLIREKNEDSIFAGVKDECGLFCVADGMGGHYGGEIASGKLVSRLSEWWNCFSADKYSFDSCYDELKNIIITVNEELYCQYSQKGNICGTTVALLFIFNDIYMILNSGDSRIYSRHGLKFRQESVDHIYGTESVISGKLTASQAKFSSDKNKLTAAVGSKKELKMYISCSHIKKGSFFICSDGVYKYCSEADVRRAVNAKNPVMFISAKTEKNGAADNYSFIIINIR